MVKPTKPMIGYARVSRLAGREGESFISPDDQRTKIKQWAELKHVEIGWWFEDLDVSGGKLERPGLDQALELIRSGQAGGIAVARLDRLSRAGVADALKLVEEIQSHGAQIAAIDLGIDPTTTTGELMMTLMLALARMERRRITESWATSQQRAVARGVYIASKKPTGYAADEGGRLIPNEDAPAIAELFRMRAGGASWKECCAFLNDKGVVGPWGKSVWRSDAAIGIIANRAYLGESKFGSYVNAEAHVPLIDEATWRAAQKASVASVPRSGEGALLSGFIRCAGCRYRLSPSKRRHRGELLRIYECKKQHASGDCPKPASILGRVIEPYVIAHFKDKVGSPEFIAQADTSELEELTAQLEQAREELITYRDTPGLLTTLGTEGFQEGLEAKATIVRNLEEEVAELGSKNPALGKTNLDEIFDGGTVADKRELLQSVIGSVFIRNLGKKASVEKRAIVLSHRDLPGGLPRRGHRADISSFDWPLN